MLARIERADDPRVADYLELREAELVRRKEIFIAEGVHVVRTLVASSPYPVRSIFIAEKHASSRAFADVLERAEAKAIPVYVAPEAVLSEVAGFDLHRGCLAAGQRSAIPNAEALLPGPEKDVVLVLEAVSNHDNVGALFRNAAAFGARALFFDQKSADPLYRKAIRVSMGHALTIPFARLGPLPDALSLLERHGYAIWALTPSAKATPIADRPRAPKIALLAGTEGTGLSSETLARTATHVKIPMAPDVDSLNVSTAVAIALYALRAI